MDNQNKWCKGMTWRQRAKIKAESNGIHEYWTFKEALLFMIAVIGIAVVILGSYAILHVAFGN